MPCWRIDRPNVRYEMVATHIDVPALALMGARDTETPANECIARLEAAKAGGAPFEWHVYPEATHCFDCENLNGFSKVDVRGNRVEYRYSKADTEDAARRMFEFFSARLRRGG
jgi:dienelactone hydrolase